MEAVLWGVRGSIANPTSANQFYGANTACVEVRSSKDDLLIFDAGTGIHSLGGTLPQEGVCHIFVSHGHNDHVQGLPFFRPLYIPGWLVHLYMPTWLAALPNRIFDGTGFPLMFSEMYTQVQLHTINPGQTIALEDVQTPVRVTAISANHPGRGLAFKVKTDNENFLYSGDHEITDDPRVLEATREMLRGVSSAVVDASFSRATMRLGWGHSAWEDWVELAKECGTSNLILSHHSPVSGDTQLDELQTTLNRTVNGVRACVAREGLRFSVSPKYAPEPKLSSWLMDFIDSLSQYRDETVLLDRILAKAREISNADAGTFFLREGDELVFAYSHNDTLFPKDMRNKSAYVNMRLPIGAKSIAGYVAAKRKMLNIPDVYDLPETSPYYFNRSFDQSSGYRSQSVLAMPVMGHENELIGVMQLINSIDPRSGDPRPFNMEMEKALRTLVREAATYLEIGAQTRESIRQLMRIVVLHDPAETGPHAERVGALCAEIYQVWAERHGVEPEEVRYFKSELRLAAMLHDVGKVGISDLILKKPGRLTDEEFAIIREHTSLAATLFSEDAKGISKLTREIALNHHQKWNGSGYPAINGRTLAGEEIPLSARLTTVADVFDAMVSPRCYKEPWSRERTIKMMWEESGKHFDPELVDILREITDIITMIYDRYPDQDCSTPSASAPCPT